MADLYCSCTSYLAVNTCMSIDNDPEYWTGLQWPAAPNDADYAVFEGYCTGRVLLLGSTQLLLPLIV